MPRHSYETSERPSVVLLYMGGGRLHGVHQTPPTCIQPYKKHNTGRQCSDRVPMLKAKDE